MQRQDGLPPARVPGPLLTLSVPTSKQGRGAMTFYPSLSFMVLQSFKPVSLWVRSKRCGRVTPVIESLCHHATRHETVEEKLKSRDVFLSLWPLRTPEDAMDQMQTTGWGHWLSQVREPGAVNKLFPF